VQGFATLAGALGVTAGPTLAFVAASAVALWGVSLWRRDASVADPAWGPGFVGVALVATFAGGGPPGPRAWLALACVGAWGLRLGVHLLRRNLAHGEDRRYVAMRETHGARFRWVSLFTVFLLQGALLWVVSLPLQVAARSEGALGALDAVALLVFLAGLAFEVAADAQLAAFRADPASRGRVLDHGVWAWSRHPNYFGDALLWWGLGGFALAAGAWPALLGPALMTLLLRRVSGVTLLEKDIAERRPGYAAYVRDVPPFVPRWPRRRRDGGASPPHGA
jgi:steroid 5-alpha reductase family enzyme